MTQGSYSQNALKYVFTKVPKIVRLKYKILKRISLGFSDKIFLISLQKNVPNFPKLSYENLRKKLILKRFVSTHPEALRDVYQNVFQ